MDKNKFFSKNFYLELQKYFFNLIFLINFMHIKNKYFNIFYENLIF
jgi:hypothetical protein